MAQAIGIPDFEAVVRRGQELVVKKASTGSVNFGVVIRLAYQEILLRSADAGGLAGWNEALNSGVSESQMREAFLRSGEFQVRFPSATHVVALGYRKYLQREPDTGGLAGWNAAIASGLTEADFRERLIRSGEFAQTNNGSYGRVIDFAYPEILQRPADLAGKQSWNQALVGGMAEAQMREAFIRSDEFRQKNPGGSGMALSVSGNQFVNGSGQVVRLLGAIICCENAKPHWWPLVDEASLQLFADNKLNYTHIRLGPFTLAGEDDTNYVGYKTMPDGRVDLDQWNPDFWGRVRTVVFWARQRGIYVEVDLVDRWIRQHGEEDIPECDPWLAHNNIQGIDAGGLKIFQRRPSAIHERWVRKVIQEIGEFDNVIFQVGNEGFKSFSADWEVGVYQIVKDELARLGYSNRLVGTNTGDPSLEGQLDYITRHRNSAQAAGVKPILVNEYAPIPAGRVLDEVRRARQMGTAFMYWRGDHDEATWRFVLSELRKIVESGQ